MATRHRIDWKNLRYKFSDAAEYVGERKKRFIALAVGGVLSVSGYNFVNSPEFAQRMEQNRKVAEEQQQALQGVASKADVRGPGQGAVPVGALIYLFDFNTKKVMISGEGGTQDVTFDSVFKGELAKEVKNSICKDAPRRDRFGLHYCQQ